MAEPCVLPPPLPDPPALGDVSLDLELIDFLLCDWVYVIFG